MKIFVLGGSGFIGSYVVNELLSRGHTVTVLARNPKKMSVIAPCERVKILTGTLQETEIIKEGLKGQEACIHIALGWGNTAVEMLDADTKTAVYIFETAAKMGVKKIIYTSSTAAIGELCNKMNEQTRVLPVDFYGADKVAIEAYLNAIASVYGISCNIIRPAYTFGNPIVPNAPMEVDSRFRQIVADVKKHKPVQLIKNDGTQFIWAGDLAKLYAELLESSMNRKTYIAAGKDFITWAEIAQIAIDYLKSGSVIVQEDQGWKKGECVYDSSAVYRDFGILFSSQNQIEEHIHYLADMENSIV